MIQLHANRIVLLAIALTSFSGTRLGEAADSNAPNIILILTDDQGWNGTSVRMDPNIPGSASDFYQTPSLEALAARGMRFSDAYSASPVCAPTRSSLLTGRSPAQIQITNVETTHFIPRNSFGNQLKAPISGFVDPDQPTLPERVKLANPSYVTGTFGKWHIAGSPEFHGYDESAFSNLGNDPRRIRSITEDSKNFINARVAAEEPFFMQVAHISPHRPIQAKPETIEKYESLPPGTVHRRADYAAMIEELDTGIGELLDHVDQLGLSDNTYVIFTSDNASAQYDSSNAPLYRDKGTVWEGGIRVPFIAAGPGIAANTVSRVPIVSTDLYSTIDRLAGGVSPLPDGVEGADLTPILENSGQLPFGSDYLSRQHAEGGALYFHFPHNVPTTVFGRTRPQSAVRDGDYKLVRLYGEGDEEDLDLLFNVRSNIENGFLSESNSPSSSLNIAEEFPDIAAELSGKLNRWLESVDASQAYTLSDKISLNWQADRLGSEAGVWRSTNNVDNKPRESWQTDQIGIAKWNERPEQERATIQTISPYQAGLGKQAFAFDGNDAMQRVYFHLSDSLRTNDPVDNDRSVALEMWVRLSDLNSDQLLLESGKANQGLSLTLGDDDGDASHNDLRFRLRSADGKVIEAVAAIDKFVDVTSDFVHLSAVYNDDPNDRHAAIYVNGALAGRTNGLSGVEETIHWDGLDLAGLGGVGGASIGGVQDATAFNASISGLRGEVPTLRYHNHYLDASEIAAAYSTDIGFTRTGIVGVTGDAIIPDIHWSDVSDTGTSTGSNVIVMHERTDVLRSDVALDFVPESAGTIDAASSSLDGGILEEGEFFTSHLIHFAPDQTGSVAGSVEFSSEIIGLLLDDSSLTATDSLLGSLGKYSSIDRTATNFGEAVLTLSSDLKTLLFAFDAEAGDLYQLRVLTTATRTGDFNGDGVVDAADYTVWRESLSDPADLRGDGNRDGLVDEADYRLWRSLYGNTLAAQSEAEQVRVPEPTTGLLVVIAAMLTCGIHRRRN